MKMELRLEAWTYRAHICSRSDIYAYRIQALKLQLLAVGNLGTDILPASDDCIIGNGLIAAR